MTKRTVFSYNVSSGRVIYITTKQHCYSQTRSVYLNFHMVCRSFTKLAPQNSNDGGPECLYGPESPIGHAGVPSLSRNHDATFHQSKQTSRVFRLIAGDQPCSRNICCSLQTSIVITLSEIRTRNCRALV